MPVGLTGVRKLSTLGDEANKNFLAHIDVLIQLFTIRDPLHHSRKSNSFNVAAITVRNVSPFWEDRQRCDTTDIHTVGD
jgi:hypothetical protein